MPTPPESRHQDQDSPGIAVVKRGALGYSETFIRAHIERLPAHFMQLDAGCRAPLLSLMLRASPWCSRPLDVWMRTQWRRLFQAHAIEVVLAEFGPTGVAVMRQCEAVGLPLVVHFHGRDAYHRATLAGPGRRYGELFARAAAIVVVSRHMEQQLLRLGAPRARLHYNPCGVDTGQFYGARPAQAPPVLLAAGRFVTKKGPELTLRAFHRAWLSCPAARLLMLGDGPLWGACQRLARQLGMAAAVSFLGPRPHAEVATRMRQARAFVQHSICASDGNREGTPLVVLEAAASGLPVVATRHGGILDAVVEGTTGLLVDEGDVESMAAAMLCLLRDPDLAARFGAAGRQRVCAVFAMEQRLASLRQIIAAVRPGARYRHAPGGTPGMRT